MRFKYQIIIFLILLLPSYLAAMAAEKRLDMRVSWRSPVKVQLSGEDFSEAIYFEGAVYTDTMPLVPVFSHSLVSDIPHFRYSFSMDNKEFVPVSPGEREVLVKSGLKQNEIALTRDMQSQRGERFDVVSFYPFRYDHEGGGYEKLVSFSLVAGPEYEPGVRVQGADVRFAENSVLAQGSWYRICVERDGIYRMGYSELEALGINPSSVVKQNISLFGNGNGMLPEANSADITDDLAENAIYVSGQGSDTFGQEDYILFYGRSPNTWYLEENDEGRLLFRHNINIYTGESCYFLTTDRGEGKRIENRETQPESNTRQVTVFRDRAFHQRDLVNLIGSGRIWFGEVFDATTSRQFSFDFPNLAAGRQATVEAYMAARSSAQSSFTVSAGDSQRQMPIIAINPNDYNGFFVRSVNSYLDFMPSSSGSINVTLNYNRPMAGSRGWLNYLVVNADRDLRFTGGQMAFRQLDYIKGDEPVEYIIDGAAEGLRVWDVTDSFILREQELNHQGGSVSFTLPADTVREFIAFDGSDFHTPSLKGEVVNQNLHAMKPHDMIIVCPGEMLVHAERLAAYRRENDGLSVGIVTAQQVYNEFSSGSADISAIRNFMKMFYDRAGNGVGMPRYLLLFGNGTYDNKDLLGYGGNLIPTYQSGASYSYRESYMTDDYFGLLADHEGEEGHGVLDLGIGRLPVRTPEEAGQLVDKIIRYDKRIPELAPEGDNLEYSAVVSNYADWRNRIVFIADDGDNNRHLIDSEILANSITENNPLFNVEKIYLDAYQQQTMSGGARYPGVNRAINESFNNGAILINYIGHGGVRGLAHQRILTFEDIAGWENRYNMPVFMTATCEFSSFDQPSPEELSAGVRIVIKPVGGTVALFTTTRLAWSGNNMTLNRNFMNTTFGSDDGEPLRMGDMIRKAKNASGIGTIPRQLRNFVLLGDPSMRMAFPEHRVVTSAMPDTIRAYEEVKVSGYVTDNLGNRADDYNGVIFPTVYDKKSSFKTLGNNPGSIPVNFGMRNSVLYKGKASVTDGEFSFSFMVPRDIAYSYGEGKISYYLDDGNTDGHGYHQDFVIGGTLGGGQTDSEGPLIELYMNDTTFVSGDYTNENPILLAFLHDGSGINMTGSIGHDIVAFLNDNINEPIRLTGYYQADLDTYKSGRVVYPFRNLEDGHHSLSLRAWDAHNNPSSASIDFVVSSTGSIVLEDLMNYPNPFSHDTWFTFKHNQAFNEVDVQIDIFDMQGRLVNTITERVNTSGFRSTPIHWNGMSNSGRSLGNGIYLYRLSISSPSGQRAVQTEKLVIFR